MTLRDVRETPATAGPDAAPRTVRDSSGYAVFAGGEAGAAHATAHRLLDTGRIALGRATLGDWLARHSGSGSGWVHLHFHMAVFELAEGDWHAAHARFLREVLPVAASTDQALTDAPALLWRLALSAPRTVALPWQPLRRTALRNLHRSGDAYVELHNLLALAGAGDTAGIDKWLTTCAAMPSRPVRLVEQTAAALCALAAGSFGEAANALHQIAPQVASIGGSRAQNQLFDQLAAWSRQRAGVPPFVTAYANAA